MVPIPNVEPQLRQVKSVGKKYYPLQMIQTNLVPRKSKTEKETTKKSCEVGNVSLVHACC